MEQMEAGLETVELTSSSTNSVNKTVFKQEWTPTVNNQEKSDQVMTHLPYSSQTAMRKRRVLSNPAMRTWRVSSWNQIHLFKYTNLEETAAF